MIWFSELLEPVENFEKFFNRTDNKILDVRNVWLLNIRNMNTSDHHSSFEMAVSVNNFQQITHKFIGNFERCREIHGR